MNWTSEITNDSTRDYSLVVELLADEQYMGRLFVEDGLLRLKVYPHMEPVVFPVDWLSSVIQKAITELC